VRLAEIEPPGNNTRGFAIIRAVPFFIIDGKEGICAVCSAYIHLKGGFGKG